MDRDLLKTKPRDTHRTLREKPADSPPLYSRTVSTPTILSDEKEIATSFDKKAGMDKLWMRHRPSIDLSPLAPYRLAERLPYRRSFKTSSEYSATYRLPTGAGVAIYSNEFEVEMQINPTEWRNYEELSEFLIFLGCKLDELKIIRLHCFVDIPFTIEDVLRDFNSGRKRLSDKFRSSTETSRSGHLDELKYTRHFGSVQRDVLAIYDAAKKHGKCVPTTRIERRMNSSTVIPTKTFLQLPSLVEKKILEPITFFALDDAKVKALSLRDRERLLYLQDKRDSDGMSLALKRLRSLDPKHFKKRTLRALDCFVPKKIVDLQYLLNKELRVFFGSDPGPSE